uniref:tigger transposable element-derived protein 2-like n=1 Tax=Myxine glutinosa TaxID=7769 RepID=UPI00358F9432
MPRNYVRKSTRQSWTVEAMEAALQAIENGDMGYKKAAKEFGVPKTTLKRRHKGGNKTASAKGSSKTLGRYKMVFSTEMETALVQYILSMEQMMFGMTTVEVRRLAYQMAEQNHLQHPFKNAIAGKDWLRGFFSRHQDLSIRQPEATSAARAHGFNRQAVNRFFDLLEDLMEQHNFPPDKVYNVDETGMTTVQSRPSKIIALKGRRQVGSITSAERGVLVTMEICMSATGAFVPPLFVWPRVRMKPELMDGAPLGSISQCHKSGWMQTEIFTIWFEHFLKVSGASKENKVLLILDGHKTHTQNLDVITMAKDNGVYMLSIPPHCSHKIQPLDVSFMTPLSTYYTQEVERWLRQHLGRCVTVFQLASLFGTAYRKSATAENAANGFRKTGIFPVNRNIFQDHEFAPATVTDLNQNEPRPMDDNQRPLEDAHRDADVPAPGVNAARGPEDAVRPVGGPAPNGNAARGPANAVRPVDGPAPNGNAARGPGNAVRPVDGPAPNGNAARGPENAVRPIGNTQRHAAVPRPAVASTSREFISPFQISPPPKATPAKGRPTTRQSKRSMSEHLTSSPYKKRLADAAEEKKRQEAQKAEKAKQRAEKKPQKQKKVAEKPKKKIVKGKRAIFTAPEESSESEDDDGTMCLFCRESYSVIGEGWIKCTVCRLWAHDGCAGVDEEDVNFICDFCA